MDDKDDQLVDYAFPTMQAEWALAALHYAALKQDWSAARIAAIDAVMWACKAHAALAVMKERAK